MCLPLNHRYWKIVDNLGFPESFASSASFPFHEAAPGAQVTFSPNQARHRRGLWLNDLSKESQESPSHHKYQVDSNQRQSRGPSVAQFCADLVTIFFPRKWNHFSNQCIASLSTETPASSLSIILSQVWRGDKARLRRWPIWPGYHPEAGAGQLQSGHHLQGTHWYAAHKGTASVSHGIESAVCVLKSNSRTLWNLGIFQSTNVH